MRKPTYLALKLSLFALFFVLAGLAVLFHYQCPILRLTGIICPGCGMSRAWLAAFHLDFEQAFYYNPVFWFIPVIMLFILFDFKLFKKRMSNIVIASLLCMVAAASYIVRLSGFLQGKYII